MKRYKSQFKEASITVPYSIYGNGNLSEFVKYFINYYNSIWNDSINPNDVEVTFKEIKDETLVTGMFVNTLQKQFRVIFDVKSGLRSVDILNCVLSVTTFFSDRKPKTIVTMTGMIQTVGSKKTSINVIFK